MNSRPFWKHAILSVAVALSCLVGGLVPVESGSSVAHAAASGGATAPGGLVAEARAHSQGGLPFSETGLYIVQLSEPSLASYTGGIDNLRATSPQATGAARLDANSPDSRAYLEFLNQRQAQFLARAGQSLGRSVAVVHSYKGALNALALEISHDEALAMTKLDGVRAVFADTLRELETDEGPLLIGAPNIWNGATGGGSATRGEGIVIGIIDSGINSQHPAFAATDGDGYAHTNPYGAGVYRGWCVANPGFCNSKLIGAYGLNPVGASPEDTDGHGSHTASTAGGNRHTASFSVGPTPYNIEISGVAPRANIVAYKVCNPGCPGSASIAAVNSAIVNDQVDVLNYSISGVDNPWLDAVDLAFLDASNAGIFVAASAGNAGPGASTVAKTGPWNAAVAASTINRVIAHTLDVTSPGTPPELQGLAAVPGENTVIAADINGELRHDAANPLGCTPFSPGFFTGSLALVQRGGCTFAVKVTNAANAGATGVVMFNSVGGPPISMGGLNATPPAVMLDLADGLALRDFVAANPDTTIRINVATALIVRPEWEDIVAGFSSRGPSQFELLKPDFIAPGVNILAAVDQAGGDPVQYGFLQGTSMSSPHAAGAGALLMALNPSWTPAEIRSALATSSVGGLFKEDEVTPATPFDVGSGRLALAGAGQVGLVMNETGANYVAANPAIGGDPKTLNQPSMVDFQCAGNCSWTRTVRSALPVSADYIVNASAPPGMSITVTPDVFTIPAGGSQELTITANVGGLPLGAPAFGAVTLETDAVWPANLRGGPPGSSFGASASPNLAIPDNGYNGTLASMACSVIDASSIPAGSTITDVTVQTTASHTWVGDLTFKLETPDGTVLALVERPQGDAATNNTGDNGTSSPVGDSSDMVTSHPLRFNDAFTDDPEQMGLGIGGTSAVCRDDSRCEFFPNPDQALVVGNSVANFAALAGENAAGNWRLCMGDSAGGDTGTFAAWSLTIDYDAPSGGRPVAASSLPIVVIPQALDPEIEVNPGSLSSTQAVDTITTQSLGISNIGNSDLVWSIDEAPVSVRIGLTVQGPDAGEAPIVLSVDDGVGENAIGVGGAQFVWLNRFTPAVDQFPVVLDRVDIMFGYPGSTGGINVGELVDIYLYEDADGNPANGATHRASLTGQAVQAVDGTTWSTYNLAAPVSFDGPGDILIAVVNRTAGVTPSTFPAVIDQSSPSQQRSWAGFGAVPGNPPVFPLPTFGIIDSFGAQFAGNWLVRGFGTASAEGCANPADVPWLSLAPSNGTTAPGATTNVEVSLDSTGLAVGVYEALLCVTSNDPANPLIEVPVSMTVEEDSGDVVTICSTPNLPITDNNPAGVSDTISVAADLTIVDFDVYIRAPHTWVGDLRFTLQHVDSGTTAILIDRPGVPTTAFGCSGDNYDVWVDDEGPDTPIENQCANLPAITGNAPGGDPPGPVLSVFNGLSTQGDWVLTAIDNAAGDTGTLAEWCVRATVGAVEAANIDVDPLSMAATQAPDTTTQQALDIGNTGGSDLTWTIDEVPASVLVQANAASAAVPASAASDTGHRGAPSGGPAPVEYSLRGGFTEGFDDITDLPGWFTQNNSSPAGTTNWFQGNDTVFPAHAGAPSAYIGANFNNTAGAGTISNWLLTPELNLANGDTFSFWTRVPTGGGSFPDRLELRLSVAGASTDVGTLATDVGDFATLLLAVNPDLTADGYPEVWTQYTVTLAGIPPGASGRIAFRYFVTDGGPSGSNSNYIGIDSVEYVSGGEPGVCDAPADVPWLSVSPTNGTTTPGATTPVEVTFDSTGLAVGTYDANLCVISNDPDPGPGNGTGLVIVPVSLTVEIQADPAIEIVKTVGTVEGVCAATDEITVPAGSTVYYCYEVTNTGNVTLNLHDLVDDQLGAIFSGLNYALTPGSSVNTVAAGLSIPAVINTNTTNTATWTAYNEGGANQVTAQASATVNVVFPGIGLTKTVGTVDGVCAATSEITVTVGTEVYYCYAVTNTGQVTLNLHDLVDDQLGAILGGFNFALTPGSSVNTVAAGLSIPAVINANTTNTATWTAYNQGGANQVTAQASATVNVLPQYTVTALVGTPGGGSVTGVGVFNSGETATVEAIPATGYIFLHWLVDGSFIEENPYSFQVEGDITLTAFFELESVPIPIPTNSLLGLLLLFGLMFGIGVFVLRRTG